MKHILICNERFQFRYGVDRVLIELAKKLKVEGFDVSIACLRYDELALSFGPVFVAGPFGDSDHYDYEKLCFKFLEDRWEEISANRPVDAIITGGWPFFSVASFGSEKNVPTIFIDAGAVPHDRMSETAVQAQQAVKRIRASYLRYFDRVLPISEFIKNSQTIQDRGTAAGVQVIPLAFNHLAANVFAEASIHSGSRAEDLLVKRLENLVNRGVPLILNLGRFESGYKNSDQSFAVLRDLVSKARDIDSVEPRLILLAHRDDVSVPADLIPYVLFAGFPCDQTLQKIMELASVGFSPSLWEGFNLPIGEMQILNKCVIAFNVGAHPEVIKHPWFLCVNTREASEKIARIFNQQIPHSVQAANTSLEYKGKFDWERTLKSYLNCIQEVIIASETIRSTKRAIVFIDVSNSSIDTANSGVVRVTRSLSRIMKRDKEVVVIFVFWDGEAYNLLGGERRHLLSGYNGPVSSFEFLAANNPSLNPDVILKRLCMGSARKMLLIPEVVMDGTMGQRVSWGELHGLPVAAIVYDMIPIEHPEFCSTALKEKFPAYVKALARTSTLLSISDHSLSSFNRLVRKSKGRRPKTKVIWLPGQLANEPRNLVAEQPNGREIKIICVSTLELRKNHKSLLSAYSKLRSKRPELRVSLTLIGNTYAGAEALTHMVNEYCKMDRSIRWLGALKDTELIEEYKSASFSVYPSLVEGFGLPILESLWMGKPCICHHEGVMAELAEAGGCLKANMRDDNSILSQIERLIDSPDLYRRLTEEAISRPIDTWDVYTKNVMDALELTDEPENKDANGHLISCLGKSDLQFNEKVKFRADILRRSMQQLAQVGFENFDSRTIFIPEPLIGSAGLQRQILEPHDISKLRAFSIMPMLRKLLLNKRWSRFTKIDLVKSGFFDEAWYLWKYPDVANSGLDAAEHFVRHGHKEMRSPGPNFDSYAYAAAHPEIKDSDMSPFEYYLKNGALGE